MPKNIDFSDITILLTANEVAGNSPIKQITGMKTVSLTFCRKKWILNIFGERENKKREIKYIKYCEVIQIFFQKRAIVPY